MYGGRYLPHAAFAALKLGEPWSMPTVAGSGIRPVASGSGKPGTPWLRTHRENCSDRALICWTRDSLGGRPPPGRRLRHALSADWNAVLETPSCTRERLGGVPVLSGSG
jgi:hypothetical protein